MKSIFSIYPGSAGVSIPLADSTAPEARWTLAADEITGDIRTEQLALRQERRMSHPSPPPLPRRGILDGRRLRWFHHRPSSPVPSGQKTRTLNSSAVLFDPFVGGVTHFPKASRRDACPPRAELIRRNR
jgi:hypothetical protein